MAWTKERIVEDLRELRLREGDAVLVHADVRAIGPMEHGVRVLQEALLEVIGKEGTLLSPAFRYTNYAVPVSFDLPSKEDTLTQEMILQRAAYFSIHPVHRFAAIGSNALFLTENAPFHYPLGENSPLARLYQLNGGVLLIGVGQALNSALHLAEVWADVPYARRPAEVLDETGGLLRMEGNPECSAGFGKIESILRQARILRTGYIGNAPSQFLRIQQGVSMAIEMLRGNPESLLCDNPDCSSCTQARRLTTTQTPILRVDHD